MKSVSKPYCTPPNEQFDQPRRSLRVTLTTLVVLSGICFPAINVELVEVAGT